MKAKQMNTNLDIATMKIRDNVLETIGNTPLVKLNNITNGIKAKIYVKLEFLNPGGSVKDRIGIKMIEDAERKGLLKPGGTIVESTSGNTGMGLALVAAVKGYKVIFTIPDKMSPEKINLLKVFGAKVIITPTAVSPDHPNNYVKVAEKITKELPDAFMPHQYFNPANPEIHYKTTGPEIWEQTGGNIDVFVAGMGTGGTISGTGKYLKEMNPNIKIVGADPEGSMYHHEFYNSHGEIHPYKVEGIGEDFMPSTYNPKVIDEIEVVSDKDAFLTARRLATEEGIFVGGSSGAAVFVALHVARKLDKDQNVVIILPDTGRNYMTTIYSDEWMSEHGFIETAGEKIPVDEILKAKSNRIDEVFSVHPEDNLSNTLALMTKHDISQLPVMKESVQVGSVNEKNLMERLCKFCGATKQRCTEMCDHKVEEFMEPPLPTLKRTDTITKPIFYFKEKNAVLVLENKKIVDIITMIDVINYLARR